MSSIDLLVFEIEFGLYPVAEDAPGLTIVVFVAMSLLLVLGMRFAYYAHRNLAGTEIEVQAAIWTLLRYVGLLAALFGGAGILEVVSSLTFEAKNGLLLAMTLLLALSLRQIYHTATGGDRLAPERVERLLGVVFAAVVLVYVAIVAVTGQTRTTAALEGTTALVFALYGGAYFRSQAAESRLQGTMLNSLLRHLLPVLVFAALVGTVALAVPLGVSRLVVLHVQVVFLIMAATALMTATIKLRQNLASLSAPGG